jgi:hypothetical protein
VFQTVQDAYETSANIFRRAERDPALWRDKCEFLRQIVLEALGQDKRIAPDGAGRIRVAIAERDDGLSGSLRLKHCAGFEDTPDQSLLLPIRGTVAGKSWDNGRFHLERAPFSAEFGLAGPQHVHMKRLVQRDLKWILCVPVDLPPPLSKRIVFCIDGTQPLRRLDETETFVRELARATNDFIIDGLSDEDEID